MRVTDHIMELDKKDPGERGTIRKDFGRLAFVLLGALLMAFNIRTFVRAGNLYPGGATGLSLLIIRLLKKFAGISLPYAPVNIILNAIPVYIGFRFIGKKFTGFSLVMIVANSLLVDLIPAHAITYDPLLIAIFGGMINGLAISLCLMVGATSGGTDFISIYISKKTGKDAFNIILGMNVCILAIAGLNFGWDKALYSIVFQYFSTQVLHLLYRNYQKVTMFIVTDSPDEVSKMIYEVCRHGSTRIEGKGGYKGSDRTVVYSVIDAPESNRVIQEIYKIDPHAFVNSVQTKELRGNFYYKQMD
ncbi:MAG: YitT family protein [Lachnospiraceae bacterium]|nr:YitT family protein [Lachnospiraceae bacterium]MDD6449824.1 YitT family protein [Lachnospiraceae bacterium]MDD6451429.1 YitT family protein [Lachnospiraceae bacterium]MDD6578800.1 YitT family protein [Lachnospiraceae bacterium]